jgi:serine/threonine-protein kinase RsbW
MEKESLMTSLARQGSENMAGQAHLLLRATLGSVEQAEHSAVQEARKLGFPEVDQYRIGLSVHEAMLNAVSHGSGFNPRGLVRFRLETDRRGLAVEVEDDGPGFNPVDVPDPLNAANLKRAGGRGLLLVRTLMDEVDVLRLAPHGTRIRMVKHFHPAKEAAGGEMYYL